MHQLADLSGLGRNKLDYELQELRVLVFGLGKMSATNPFLLIIRVNTNLCALIPPPRVLLLATLLVALENVRGEVFLTPLCLIGGLFLDFRLSCTDQKVFNDLIVHDQGKPCSQRLRNEHLTQFGRVWLRCFYFKIIRTSDLKSTAYKLAGH